MYHKIKNPETSRYVSIHSKLGKQIINNYINQIINNKLLRGGVNLELESWEEPTSKFVYNDFLLTESVKVLKKKIELLLKDMNWKKDYGTFVSKEKGNEHRDDAIKKYTAENPIMDFMGFKLDIFIKQLELINENSKHNNDVSCILPYKVIVELAEAGSPGFFLTDEEFTKLETKWKEKNPILSNLTELKNLVNMCMDFIPDVRPASEWMKNAYQKGYFETWSYTSSIYGTHKDVFTIWSNLFTEKIQMQKVLIKNNYSPALFLDIPLNDKEIDNFFINLLTYQDLNILTPYAYEEKNEKLYLDKRNSNISGHKLEHIRPQSFNRSIVEAKEIWLESNRRIYIEEILQLFVNEEWFNKISSKNPWRVQDTKNVLDHLEDNLKSEQLPWKSKNKDGYQKFYRGKIKETLDKQNSNDSIKNLFVDGCVEGFLNLPKVKELKERVFVYLFRNISSKSAIVARDVLHKGSKHDSPDNLRLIDNNVLQNLKSINPKFSIAEARKSNPNAAVHNMILKLLEDNQIDHTLIHHICKKSNRSFPENLIRLIKDGTTEYKAELINDELRFSVSLNGVNAPVNQPF